MENQTAHAPFKYISIIAMARILGETLLRSSCQSSRDSFSWYEYSVNVLTLLYILIKMSVKSLDILLHLLTDHHLTRVCMVCVCVCVCALACLLACGKNTVKVYKTLSQSSQLSRVINLSARKHRSLLSSLFAYINIPSNVVLMPILYRETRENLMYLSEMIIFLFSLLLCFVFWLRSGTRNIQSS